MMTPMAPRTVLSLCLSLAALASADAGAADCQERTYDLLRAAYPGATGETGDEGELLRTAGASARWINLGKVVCKVWPASPDKTLLAVPLQHEAATGLDVDTADLEVLVVDSARPRILQRYRENEALTSDAVQITALTLDTARYKLDERTTAFGLRIGYSGSSRANPYSSTVLNLYAADADGQLRPVLSKLEVEKERGEWDTNCAGEFESVRRTVAIDPKRDHGYAGLRVNSVTERRRNVAKGKDCADVPGKTEKRSARLTYDGRRYAVPEELRGL